MPLHEHHDHAEFKRREAAFIRLKNQILRESSNPASFAQARARALADRELQADSILATMVRAFIAEREHIMRQVPGAPGHEANHTPRFAHGHVDPHATHPSAAHHAATLDDVRTQLVHLVGQYHYHLSHFFEPEARAALEKIVALHAQHPDFVPTADIRRAERELDRMLEQRAQYLAEIDMLAADAVAAAENGDNAATSKALTRLSSFHTVHPQLLPDERFNHMREQIVNAARHHQHHAAALKLVGRERAVAAEIRSLADTIHHFHRIARTAPHDSDDYRRAEAAYHAAVRDVRLHDREWMAELILELVDLLDEIGHPSPRTTQQVDHFIASVRHALSDLRHAIVK